MNRRAPKVVQMPAPQLESLTRADWERIARETFAERKTDVGRVPDRRRAPVPTWQPPDGIDSAPKEIDPDAARVVIRSRKAKSRKEGVGGPAIVGDVTVVFHDGKGD